MPRYRISITSQSGQAMTDLVCVHKIQVLDHGARRDKEAGFLVYAIVQEADIKRLQDAGYTVQQLEDVDETGKARQKEVGRGNRYKQDKPR
jgi:carboxypeptidase T